MTYLYSWLKEFYPELPSVAELEPLLIQLGHDVELVTPLTYAGIVVAEITEVTAHPNADRLRLVTITDGTLHHTVVCGAPNVALGQKVAYAPLGTTLPCGLRLESIKIRGQGSDGMLCAEDELGLVPSHAELLSFPATAKLGESIKHFVPEDALFSLDITPNRGDVLSHFGLARDIYAVSEKSVLTFSPRQPTYSQDNAPALSIGELDPTTLAIAFGAVAHEGPSPTTPLFWQARLHLLSQKSINLATDITNYLLLAYGQPLHAYAAEKLTLPAQFGIRYAKDNEPFLGLNNITYALKPNNLVITNHGTPVSLAGILGDETTKITKDTTRVIFESAAFDPKTITLSSRSSNLVTDSSQRFARGVDPMLHQKVLTEAQAMWQETTGGQVFAPIEKINHEPDEKIIKLSITGLTRRLGTPISKEEVANLAQSLGLSVETAEVDTNTITLTPPSWRFDLVFPQDIDEEVARLLGLSQIPKSALPATVPLPKRSRYWRIEQVKDLLASTGGYEIRTYPFLSLDEVQAWDYDATHLSELEVAPLANKSFLRPSLKPSLVANLAANPDIPTLVVFEIAKVFSSSEEFTLLGIGVATNNQVDADTFWRNLFEKLKLPVSSWMSRVTSISDTVRELYKVRKTHISLLELPIEEIIQLKQFESPVVIIPDPATITYNPPAKFPTSRRDIAFIVETQFNEQDIAQAIKNIDDLIVDVILFDKYRNSATIGEDKVSLAYHIYYQAPDKTLDNETVLMIHQAVEQFLKEQYHATIR